jgi:hypothetical protein
LDDVVFEPYISTTLPTGQDISFRIESFQVLIKGFLIRLESSDPDVDLTGIITSDSPLVKDAAVCSGNVVGLTHTYALEKSTVNATLRSDFAVENVDIGVTVVYINTADLSVFAYDSYTVSFDSSIVSPAPVNTPFTQIPATGSPHSMMPMGSSTLSPSPISSMSLSIAPIKAPTVSAASFPTAAPIAAGSSASSISAPSDGGGSKSNSLGLYIIGAVVVVLVVALIVAGWVYVTIRRTALQAAAQTNGAKTNHLAPPGTAFGPLEPGQEDSNQVGTTELNQSSVCVEAEPISSPDPRTLEYKHQMRDVLAAQPIASPDPRTLEYDDQMREVVAAERIATPYPRTLEYKDQMREVLEAVPLASARPRDQQNPAGNKTAQSTARPVAAALMHTQAEPEILDSGAPTLASSMAHTRQGIDP